MHLDTPPQVPSQGAGALLWCVPGGTRRQLYVVVNL